MSRSATTALSERGYNLVTPPIFCDCAAHAVGAGLIRTGT
jgi:hypothetical protein